MPIPKKENSHFIAEMISSNLIDYRRLHPWADHLIQTMDAPPTWLCDLASLKNKTSLLKALGHYLFSEPFEPVPSDLEKFHIACLWLRYRRRELSWATFLNMAGMHLDEADGDWECEVPFHYLNQYEDAYFSVDSEEKTKAQYLAEHDLKPWIQKAEKLMSLFYKDKGDLE